MTSDSLTQLEELLGKPLPAAYLNLLDDYPETLRNAVRAIDDSVAEGTVADVELIADLPSVLAINCEARLESIQDPDGNEFFWPNSLLVIGETGSGDYYCLDVDDDVEEIIQYDSIEVDFDVVADSLDDFVELLIETFILGESSASEEVEQEETNE